LNSDGEHVTCIELCTDSDEEVSEPDEELTTLPKKKRKRKVFELSADSTKELASKKKKRKVITLVNED
jgi:hypothetical protein